ncbi:MAG: protein-disulfide reductase DsbD domain-containing protein [Cypionkella sp.]
MIKPVLLALMLAGPAFAQSQDDVLQGGLLSGWRMADGHYMAAVDLQLAPEWKTYWRAPGDAGIPPRFDWSGSKNLKSVQFHWPSPQVLTLNGMMTIGYLDQLVLPFEVVPRDASKPVTLALNMDLGVCHTVCMPAHLTLSKDLAGKGATDDRISSALQAGPVQGQGAQVNCKVEPIADGLRLTARIALPLQGSAETVVFETPDPTVWVSESKTSREGLVLVSETDLVPPNGAPFVLDRSGVTLTILAGGRSVELHGCPAS